MSLKILTPHKALNKSFLKLKPSRKDIEIFKYNLTTLFERINVKESEEFQKNLIIDFLKKNGFETDFYINTKGRNDLVIHNDKTAASPVGVIIETKSISNSSEMISAKRLNAKALQELLLYFLRERITHKNLELKHLIVTNLYEWFIFDAYQFEQFFAKNKKLVKQFEDFETKRLSGISTDVFYKEIAKPFLDEIVGQLEFTYLNLKDYESIIKNNSQKDDNKLIGIFKIFSAAHLLKLPFINDSNTLDKSFYNELLHIIGLTETKEGGKRLIERNKLEQRNSGSLLEDTIIQLDSLDKVNRISKPFLYGDSYEERLFNIALELNITWINRVLFLKLMEGQLVTYHKGDRSFLFLNFKKIRQYDDLNTLFFQVLARKNDDRNDDVKKIYEKVPYLNSSLFEPTELEHSTLIISNLKDEKKIPILSTTVLKDVTGKKITGELTTLEYLFEFLDSYDFASEGTADILEENKTLINASVLGLIFEKINGYKDGSFYTPGFITMYMCNETLRKAVIQKFNEIKDWNCDSIVDLHNKISNIQEANEIVNSLRVCDPAVGSGHFLVSALNELIAIKNDLAILADKSGKKLKGYNIEVQNDELIITDENGELFEYNPKVKESQRIQETMFHEKQSIIENCLFGVDINPNSVKICRLRLWIELLKNAYYKSENELETLPNIDINIKNGNSLINRFGLESSLASALKKSGISIEKYKEAVDQYRNAESKSQKWELEQLINDIKTGFRTEISKNGKEIKSLNLLRGEYYTKYQSEQLFEAILSKAQQKDKKVLEDKIKKIEDFIEEIKNNKIYENAFEWRFEFPEVLDHEGNFIGFDAIIGNPPYIQLQKMGAESDALQQMEYETYAKTGDIYSLFYELGYDILKPQGILTFITSNKWMRAAYGESLRKFFVEKTNPEVLIDFSGNQIFDTATVDTNILTFTKDKNRQQTEACVVKEKLLINLSDYFRQHSSTSPFLSAGSWVILSPIEQKIKDKIEKIGTALKDWDIKINYGIKTGFNDAFVIDGAKRKELIDKDPKSEEIIRPLLRGRDIKRYSFEFADLFIITTFPSLNIDIDSFPAIKEHLLSFGHDRLKQTGDQGARKKTNNKWFETQDSIGYWEDFYRPKIVWIELTNNPNFYLDNNNYLLNNTIFFINGERLEYLVSFLNSNVCKWYFTKLAATSGVGTTRWIKIYIEQLRVPMNLDPLIEESLTNLSKEIQSQKSENLNTDQLEIEVNQKIYNLFALDAEEIDFIECQ